MADRDSDSQEQDVSLIDVMKAVRTQGVLNANISDDIFSLSKEVHGAVASQVKKLKRNPNTNGNMKGTKYNFCLISKS
jgi:hypothetical protein